MARMSGSWERYNAVSSLVHQPDGVGDCLEQLQSHWHFKLMKFELLVLKLSLLQTLVKDFRAFILLSFLPRVAEMKEGCI